MKRNYAVLVILLESILLAVAVSLFVFLLSAQKDPATAESTPFLSTLSSEPDRSPAQVIQEAVPTPTATPTPVPTVTPTPAPDVPMQSTEATADYFADAAFLGNSVLSGLWYYNSEQLLPLDSSHWAVEDSLTILSASSYVSQLASGDFGKIYIEFGVNELTYDKDTLRSSFDEVIDQLQADHPNAIIYLTSVTPVSAYCDSNRPFKRNDVLAFNEMLREIASEQQIWYLDVYPCLCGPDGYLPSDVTSDGVHFSAEHYKNWFDYLKTHYIPETA